MSIKKIHLRKLLKYFYLPDRARKALLRDDIRSQIRKEAGYDAGGGDFHTPFWTDAKAHVEGRLDLRTQMKLRVEGNKRRERLYPLLAEGFLGWWNEKRRWRNENFEIIGEGVFARLPIPELGCSVKIENLVAAKIGDKTNRIIYPYFAEEPVLGNEAARLGLWAMSEALDYQREDFRILDVLRGASFAPRDVPYAGDERTLFLQKYKSLIKEWELLRNEY